MSGETDARGRPIHHGAYLELTLAGVLVGYLLGSIIALSIGYAALILGFSIEGSELAAILGWGILRGIMRRTSIVENNINQTLASAVNGASAGMMFSVPALFILADQNPEKYGPVTEFSTVLMVLACITGGILGLAFIIPLRKQMIDFNRLAYPGGIAVAAILKSPGEGLRKAMYLLGGAVLSGTVYTILLATIDGEPLAHLGQRFYLPSFLNLTVLLSLMTVGVGFLSGKGGMVFGYGGFICYFVLAPCLTRLGKPSVTGLLNPPARHALVERDNASKVVAAAEALSSFDQKEAARLLLATKARTISAADGNGQPVDSLTNEQDLYDVAVAKVVVDAADRLAAYGKKRGDEGGERANHLSRLSHELLSVTRAKEVIEAAALLDAAPPAVAERIRSATLASDVLDEIHRGGAFNDDQVATLLAATQAERRVYDVPDELRSQLFRPSGIGMLIGAAIGGIIAAFPLVRSAIKSMQQAAKEKAAGESDSDEMPISLLYGGIVGGAIALAIIAKLSVPEMEYWRAGLMAILGTFWIWVAGVIVSECLGRTNWSPLSGMTLIAVTILILICSGLGSTATIVSSVIVGAAICVAIAQAGDMMLDLKSGYLVGARPKMQQIAQLLGTWLGPVLVMILIFVLHEAWGLGGDKLPAPQGQALASMINGLVGEEVPIGRYMAGAGMGAMLAFSGMGGVGVLIGLGFYMPFATVLTYTVGCLGRITVERAKGRKFVEDVGIPIAAGLIVGEALVGVGNAVYQIMFVVT